MGYIIFPYKIINEKDKQKAKLYSESEMQENFPLCWKYLNTHKEYLLKRNIQNYTEDTWYRYGRSQSLTKFNGEPKLIWPVLSLESRYAYDDQNIVFTGGGNGPYYALRPRSESSLSIYYILVGSEALNLQQLDKLLRANDIEAVLDITDKILLIDNLGLSIKETKMLRDIWHKLRDRRINRRHNSDRVE